MSRANGAPQQSAPQGKHLPLEGPGNSGKEKESGKTVRAPEQSKTYRAAGDRKHAAIRMAAFRIHRSGRTELPKPGHAGHPRSESPSHILPAKCSRPSAPEPMRTHPGDALQVAHRVPVRESLCTGLLHVRSLPEQTIPTRRISPVRRRGPKSPCRPRPERDPPNGCRCPRLRTRRPPPPCGWGWCRPRRPQIQ